MVATIEFRPAAADKIAAAFREIGRADTTPLMQEIGEELRTSVDFRFENEEDPDGNAWLPISRDGPILQKSARLRRSITYKATRRKVRVGTNVIYAGVHQYGAVIKPKSAARLAFKIGDRMIFAKQVTIPARPYLGFSQDDFEAIREIAMDFLRRRLEVLP
ncbi:phage virion morphogenesis protein [Sneathiella sp.]|uniref:phage virion morphogenesis protein n=1 Tax=Sneathiella sp. TaxID=1964365 RepID=UPI002FDF1C79